MRTSKVENSVHAPNDFLHQSPVPEIRANRSEVFVQIPAPASGEVEVQTDHLVPACSQPVAQVQADEPAATGDQAGFSQSLLFLSSLDENHISYGTEEDDIQPGNEPEHRVYQRVGLECFFYRLELILGSGGNSAFFNFGSAFF